MKTLFTLAFNAVGGGKGVNLKFLGRPSVQDVRDALNILLNENRTEQRKLQLECSSGDDDTDHACENLRHHETKLENLIDMLATLKELKSTVRAENVLFAGVVVGNYLLTDERLYDTDAFVESQIAVLTK